MEKIVINVIGWIGTILYLTAYAMVSAQKVESDSWLYQGLNILAASLLTVNTLSLHAYPAAGLNIAWAGIGVITLGRKWLSR